MRRCAGMVNERLAMQRQTLLRVRALNTRSHASSSRFLDPSHSQPPLTCPHPEPGSYERSRGRTSDCAERGEQGHIGEAPLANLT